MATWTEATAGQIATNPESAQKRWSTFYDELSALLPTTEKLRALTGRRIMLDRDSNPLEAGPSVYVRPEGETRRVRSGSPPLPPKEVARKLSILSSQVRVKPEVFAAFERAGLWKRYDAAEILARLPLLFSERPAPARREAALLWAFHVWRHNTAAARKALRSADLHVPTRGGWRKASASAFSDSWTSIGKHLDAFLAEATPLSQVCAQTATAMLTAWDDWPGTKVTSKAEWLRFLGDAGVNDGLIPTHTAMPKSARRGDSWEDLLSSDSCPIRDAGWRENHGFAGVNHPYTMYTLRGAAWWLPGQRIVDQLSSDARKRFAILVLQHLHAHGETHLSFSLGRFEREERNQDVRVIRTPLATFLISAPWFPVQHRGEDAFVRVADAWLLDRRSDPKFVARLPDEITEYLASDGKAFAILAKSPFGLRVWKDPGTAAARLAVLADVCGNLQAHERIPFRRQYDLAWQDIRGGGVLPSTSRIVVELPSGFAAIDGGDPPPRIYVRTGRDREMAKLLIDTGAHVLAASGEIDADAVVSLVNGTRRFDAHLVERGDLQLLVDGESFQATLLDPLLADRIPWLAEALVLGHEIGSRDLEKVIQTSYLEERLRRIRLRVCSSITLRAYDGATKSLRRYLYRDDDRPTLILVEALDAAQIADTAAQLSAWLHPNLRSFEPLLLRLATSRLPQGQALTANDAPSVDDYAHAVQSDIDVVNEHLALRRSDSGRALGLITPVVAYFVGAEAALKIATRLEEEVPSLWVSILTQYLPSGLAETLLALIEDTEDLATVRRALQLDYARFNHCLQALKLTPLSSEIELRRVFLVWKDDLRSALRDRLRRHFVGSAKDANALQEYVARRTLDFITFDEEWIKTHESLDRNDVQQRAQALFAEQLGEDPGGWVPDLESVRTENRKTLATFAQTALPVLKAAAGAALPSPWLVGPHEVAAAADRAGALDFAALKGQEEIMETLGRVGLWPVDIPQTLDLVILGLTTQDIHAEAELERVRKAEEVRQRNSIHFGGCDFDTTAADFASEFAATAEEFFRNGDWRTRSKLKQANLRVLPPSDPSNGGGKSGTDRVSPRPPEAIRSAMGLAGELLAFHYLKAKHRERFQEQCWVSENRRSRFPDEGSAKHGYDFRVLTSDTEWLYEVKATTGDACEFELSDNEYRTAIAAASDRKRRYRIILVQHVFDLEHCRVLELPNPAAVADQSRFRIVGRSSVRMKFELE
ncbi:MAG TPA: DUF3883 domain-containing protein [Longimicrobium sp.]|nr:DUF3883 domain-containing protein [Longimicrobium sp.]